MSWVKVDMEQYPRREHYEHYLHHVRCGYGMTVQLDVTDLAGWTKAQGVSFYAAEIYLLARLVNRHPEFRMCRNEAGDLGYWECSHPSYTVFHPETETFSVLWTEYAEDFSDFYRNYQADLLAYGGNPGFEGKPGTPPNTFDVSSIPWAHYTDFHLDLFDGGGYLLPIFTLGQYAEVNGRRLLPVTAQVHHAVCDGYHLSRFFRELQQLAEESRDFLQSSDNINKSTVIL